MAPEDDSDTRKDDAAPRPDESDAQRDGAGADRQDGDNGPLRDEYDGDAEQDGIPANGTRPVKPQGPEDFGGNAWGEGV